ncbi:hypothetical protein BZG36_00623 [Bifiguratus adelaidae]|uniref:NAD(P)-binding domain-containing protein n=1 Tax=Bifiguratus adelaidae TaxID=1938954 RepID=A0A261Y7K6_9FUNG|nr:hypothetical protein BZG36_00623 [Bifiguratus adelaidae]
MARTIVIIGGRGKVGSRLARILSAKGDTVKSLIRDPTHKDDITILGAQPVLQSIEDASVDQLAETFRGSDAVVFSAGAGGKGGPERTKKVDLEGAKKAIDATRQAGVKRFLMISAISARETHDIPAHWNEEDVQRFKRSHEILGRYNLAKAEADRYLAQQSELDWTILRPGALTEESGTGKVALGKIHLSGDATRDDVAATLSALLDKPKSKHLVLDMLNGDTPITEAVQKTVKDIEKGLW